MNQGIEHLRLNGKIVCGNKRAHMDVGLSDFVSRPDTQCKKCAQKLERIQALNKRTEGLAACASPDIPREMPIT